MIRTKLEIARDIKNSIRFYENIEEKDSKTEGIIAGLLMSLDYLHKNEN